MSNLEPRIRLEKFELERRPNARWAARVVLAWERGEEFIGTAEGQDSPQGRLLCAAQATARALERAAPDRFTLEVLGVTVIEKFYAIVVVVSLTSRLDEVAERLVGSCLIRQQPSHGAVLAVLDATNRFLGKVLQ